MARVNLTQPYARVDFRGHRFDRRTLSAFKALEAASIAIGLGPLHISQGGYNKGAVAASGGTHDLGAVIDLSIKHLDEKDQRRFLRLSRRMGWASWIRTPAQGFSLHWHGVLTATKAGYIAPGAAGQVLAYDAGRDGLRGNRIDPNPYRPPRRVRWSHLQNKVVPR